MKSGCLFRHGMWSEEADIQAGIHFSWLHWDISFLGIGKLQWAKVLRIQNEISLWTVCVVVDTEVQALPGFQRSPTSIGSYLRVPEVFSASWHPSDGLLFGKWRWRLDVWTQSQYPFPRAQGVICVLEPQSSPQDLQRNKSNAFLISLENHPKGTEGAKGWCWCAVTLPENFTEGRMRSRRKLRGEATADQIFAQDTHRLALDHGGA